MTTKERLHILIDALPDKDLAAAEATLMPLADPMVPTLLLAGDDDEPTDAEEDAGAAEAWREYLDGKARPWDEVRRELADG